MDPVEAILRHFSYGHLPPDLQEVSGVICDLAHRLARKLPADPETTVGLRKLLEAKDAFVRAAIVARDQQAAETPPFNLDLEPWRPAGTEGT